MLSPNVDAIRAKHLELAQKQQERQRKIALLVVATAVGVGALLAIAHVRQTHRLEQCVARGVKYYKDADNYPVLRATGRRTDDVIKERCEQTNSAF